MINTLEINNISKMIDFSRTVEIEFIIQMRIKLKDQLQLRQDPHINKMIKNNHIMEKNSIMLMKQKFQINLPQAKLVA